MSASIQNFRLNRLPAAGKVAITWFLVLIGFGYLASVGHLYFSYADVDGKPGVTAEDLKLKLYGKRDKSMLESKVVGGSMAPYLADESDRTKVLAWIHSGAAESGYHGVRPILEKNCVRCHSSDGAASFRPLTTFAQVSTVTRSDKGESTASWARVAHIHLQSLSVIYLLLGLVFAFCGVPEKLKVLGVSAPFVALLADFGARAFVPANVNMVYVVMAGGMLGGISTVTLVGTALWELWISGRTPKAPAVTAELAPARI